MHILLGHKNHCQMVVGNIIRLRTPDKAGEGDRIGWSNEDLVMPRQCTCEPVRIDIEKIITDMLESSKRSGRI